MITEQYKYTALSRKEIDGKRLYSTPDGLSSKCNNNPKCYTTSRKRQALANWRKRVGKDEAQRITTTAANRGTVMHNILETLGIRRIRNI